MTNGERVLALIRARPGFTDRQIQETTGIEPHQQVNGICRRLAAQGLVRRERSPHGITNHPTATTAIPPPRQIREVRRAPGSTVERANRWRVGPVDWEHTLLVLPCSAAKAKFGAAKNPDAPVSVLDGLPSRLRADLIEARRGNLADADLDDTTVVGALDGYDGSLYRQLGSVRDRLRSRHVLIVSGGYGVVHGAEPIGRYNARFRAGAWPGDLIARCLTAYVARNHLTDVVAFAAATTDYAKPVRRAAWPAGVSASVHADRRRRRCDAPYTGRDWPGHRSPLATGPPRRDLARGRRYRHPRHAPTMTGSTPSVARARHRRPDDSPSRSRGCRTLYAASSRKSLT